MVKVPLNLDSNIIVKLATTPEERAGAFKVLHDVYVDMGFCLPQANGMRTISHHSQPETPIIIAKDGEQVVGTVTLANDDSFKLPLEKDWEIDRLRSGNRKVLEATCLAIDPKYRRCNNKNVFFPLIQFLVQYATNVLDADYLVMTAHPKVRDFYEGVLYFEPIDMRVIEDYINAPAIAMFLDFKLLPTRYFQVYGKKALQRNLFKYFAGTQALETSAAAFSGEGLSKQFAFQPTSSLEKQQPITT